MAVENKYVNSDLANDRLSDPQLNTGGEVISSVVEFEVAAADDDGSIYRLVKSIPGTMRIKEVEILNDAVTGGTDYDLGIYETLGDGGAVKVADVLADGVDMSSARAIGSAENGLSNLTINDLDKTIYEHAGDAFASRLSSYDIALTANTVGTADGTIVVAFTFIQGS